MGGRGTFAAGNPVAYVYKTIDKIAGMKVLEGIGGKHSLPEEAHSSSGYIKLDKNGNFYEMRLYDKDHYLYFELAYHPEPSIDPSRRPVLHYHTYDRHFNRSRATKVSKAMKNHFLKYLRGIIL